MKHLVGNDMHKLIIGFSLCLILLGCTQENEVHEDVVWHLNPTKAQRMDVSQMVDSIFLVPLETNDSCLIKKVRGLQYKYGKFYLNNALNDIQVYDKSGNFLYGTASHIGSGPNDYVSAMSFHILDSISFELCDPVSLKVRNYMHPYGFGKTWNFSESVLPVIQYERLNEDTCVFADTDELKFYSISKNEIIKKAGEEREVQFGKVSWALHREEGYLYYSDIYPSNELYVLNEELEKDLVLLLDFGKYNFSLTDLPEDFSPSYYYSYMEEHTEYAYPFQKYISNNRYIAFFQFEKKLYVAYKSGQYGETLLFKNEPFARPQLMIPHQVQEGKIYYASEPTYLPYVVDTTLMSREDIDRMKHIDEMDNPIIVVYNLR